MCHLISVVSSFISGVVRNIKSSIFVVTVLFASSFAVVAQAQDADFSDPFGGTTHNAGSFTYPTGAESWAGFANKNSALYPIVFTVDGSITFTASVPSGNAVDVYFKFEKNPHPDTEPSYATQSVTVSGSTPTSYTVTVPAQGDKTFRSFLMYLVNQDESVVITDVNLTADAPVSGCTDPAATNYDAAAANDDGSCIVNVFDPASPVPTDAADSVLSIFSNAYTDIEDTDFNPNWGQATAVTVADDVITYSGLNYQGTQFASSDVSGYGYLNVDFYTTDATALSVFVIKQGQGVEAAYNLTGDISNGAWASVQVPLTTYSDAGVDLTAANQLKFVGDNTVVLDNIYFGGTAPVAVDTDGDGVPDSEDYAPEDPDVQTAPSTAYCATEVTHFNVEAEVASKVLLSVNRVDANNVSVSVASADADPVDHIGIGGQSNPATSVSPMTLANGVATITLTWANGAPDSASFEVLWSKESMGGNWMLRMEDLPSVNTAATCDTAIGDSGSGDSGSGDSGSGDSGSGDSTDGNTDPAPAPESINTYCATELTHHNIDNHPHAIKLTTESSGDNSMTVTASSVSYELDHFEVNSIEGGSASAVVIDEDPATVEITWPAGTKPDYTTFMVVWSDSGLGDGMNELQPGEPENGLGLGYVDTTNTCAPDADHDGVADADDAFPNDPSESADSDGDGVGDNADLAPNDPTFHTASTTVSNVVFDFEDNTVQYTGYDGVTASYATKDDAGVSRNMLKLVNAQGSKWWSGVTLAVLAAGNDFRGDGSAPATMRVYAEQDGNLNLELEADGQDPAVVNLAVAQGWNDLSFDFSTASADVNWHKIQIRPDALGDADNAAETAYYIDDVTFSGASILDSDNDGVNDLVDQLPNNASETVDSDGDGVGDNADVFPNDSNYSTQAQYDAALAIPAAPTPSDAADSVLSILSDAYTDLGGTNFNPDWGQATTFSDGMGVITYRNLNYQGIDFVSSDVSGYGYIRFDVYTTDTTALQFTIISPDKENLIDVADQLVLDQWVTIEIELTDFVADLTAVNQMKFEGNGTIVLENIYFGGTAPVVVDSDGDGVPDSEDYAPNDPTVTVKPPFNPASPVPTADASTVLSIFSDAYNNLPDSNYNPNWGQATVVTVDADVLTYESLNYQGTEFEESDVSIYGYLNIDFYTEDATELKFTIIGNGEHLIDISDQIALNQWVSVAIPLADYALNGVDLTVVHQLKTVGNGTVVLDNLYFSGLPTDRDNDGVIDINDYAPEDPDVTEAPITKYCAKEVFHFNNEAEAGTSILLSVSNSGDNSIEVNASRNSTIKLIDYMAISVPDAGATVSDVTIVDGVATATISWEAMPVNTTFEILWSEEGNPGNQMLNSGTGTDALGIIDTQDSCSEAHPTPVLSIPTTPASAPTYDPNGVISVYSDQYDDPDDASYWEIWGGTSVKTDIVIQDDNAISYSGLGYVGIQLPPLNLTSHTSFKADIYSAVDAWVEIKIVGTPGGNPMQASWYEEVSAGQWKNFTIDDITSQPEIGPVDAVTQIVISVVERDDNGDFVLATDGSIVVDNLYFYDKDYVPPTPVSLTVSMPGATEVRLVTETVGSDWDPTLGYAATDNQDGTWTYVLNPGPSEDLPYLWAADGVLENLKDNYDLGECADNNLDAGLTYANRILVAGSGDVTDDHFGACQSEVTFSVSVDDVDPTETMVHMLTSPNFSVEDAETAVYDEVDKVWTVTFDPAPASDIQYRWVVNGISENLTSQADAGLCINDGLDDNNNRNWVAGSGNVSGEIYNECTSPIYNFSATFSEEGRTYSWQDIGPDRDPSTNTEVKADIDDADNLAAYSKRQKTGPISFLDGGGMATFFNGTFFIATENDETIGFTFKEGDPVISMRVRSASAGKPVSIKLEDADGNHGVMAKAYTSAVDTWETLYFDFSRPYWGDTVYSTKYARIIVIYDEYSEATADQFFWFDDITYGDVVAPPKTGPSIALPVDFELDATAYAIGANGGSNSFVETAPDGSTAMKYVKSGDKYGSGNITLDTPINFKDGYKFSVDVYSSVARELTMKFDDASTVTHPVQRSLPMSGNGWETLTFDFSDSALMPQSKISFIQDITTQGSTNESQWTVYIDDITQVASEPYVPAADSQTFTLDAPNASSVRLIAEWNWDMNSPESPIAYYSGDGLWTVELEVAQTDAFEYLWVVDGEAEDLSDNVVDGNCDANLDAGTLVTNADDAAAAKAVNDASEFEYVNRKWLAGNNTSDSFDSCTPRVVLTLKVEDPATTVAILRGDISWEQSQPAELNDDGTWSYEMNPSANVSYKWVVDGQPEEMITNYHAGECSVDEDDGIFVEFNNQNTNRIWLFGSGNVENIYNACSGTITGFDDTDGDGQINLNDDDDDGDGVNDDSDVLPYDARFSDVNKAAFASVFGYAELEEDSPVYSFPAGAEAWAGFANANTTLYPITVAEDSVITFTGSVPAGGDADVRFRFEFNPYPDVDPAYDTVAVTVTGAAEATYTINVPSQGAKTFSSFLLYLDTRDVDVMVKDVSISSVGPGDTDGDGYNDDVDAFPADSTEWLDNDNDGVGNNADAFPDNGSETVDSDNDGVGDNADFAPNDPLVSEAPAQQIVSVKGDPAMVLGESVAVTIAYDTSDDSLNNGLGLRVHFDSSVLTFVSFDDVLEDSKISAAGPYADDDNYDNNGQTDMYLNLSWAAVSGVWPESLPEDLATLNFTAALDFAGETTPITFSTVSIANGYGFIGDAYDMGIYVDTGSWDFDKNGQADALTDGLMLLRYAFGLRGAALTAGAIASDLSQAEVEQNVADAMLGLADIDGNGGVDALTDGLMLLRYLFGLRGDPLIAGAIAAGSSRPTAADVEAYIISKMP